MTGDTDGLGLVSPRTGRAVSEAGAGVWRGRMLPLPAFLRDESMPGDPAAWLDALRLTGHFLERDAFGLHNRPLPEARRHLYHLLEARNAASG